MVIIPVLIYTFGSVYQTKTGVLDSEDDTYRAMTLNERSKLVLESMTKTNRIWYRPKLISSLLGLSDEDCYVC